MLSAIDFGAPLFKQRRVHAGNVFESFTPGCEGICETVLAAEAKNVHSAVEELGGIVEGRFFESFDVLSVHCATIPSSAMDGISSFLSSRAFPFLPPGGQILAVKTVYLWKLGCTCWLLPLDHALEKTFPHPLIPIIRVEIQHTPLPDTDQSLGDSWV